MTSTSGPTRAETRLAHGHFADHARWRLARQLEPRASAHARLEAMRRLADAGIPVSAFVSPLIPGLNDRELEKLLDGGPRPRGDERGLHAAAPAARGRRTVPRVAGRACSGKGLAHHVGALRPARRTRQRRPTSAATLKGSDTSPTSSASASNLPAAALGSPRAASRHDRLPAATAPAAGRRAATVAVLEAGVRSPVCG